MTSDKTRVCMFGASPDTGNLGVSALWHSAASALAQNIPNLDLTVFDMGKGVRPATMRLGDTTFDYTRIGANRSRRYYRSDSLWNMRLATKMNGNWNPGVRALREAHAVVDVSGGDSFADLYGQGRFELIAAHKQIALEHGARLILLPQTYGPFRKLENLRAAEEIVRSAEMAWARDERSYVALQELLGDKFDAKRHRSGVDMAFGLMRYAPAEGRITDPIKTWLARENDEIVVGVNVSGLLYGKVEENRQNFDFNAVYGTVVHELIRKLLEDDRVRVVLVPHVYGQFESDDQASEQVEHALGDHCAGRVATLQGRFDQSEAKWLIAQLDWFCGTRMHSTIAALSSGVPVAAIAYSLKTQGVFETCDQGDHVADPRELDTLDVIEKLLWSFGARDAAKASLAAALPGVKDRVESQMREIAEFAAKRAAPVL